MTHVYFIRHAEYITELVDEKYPKQDLGLSPEGIVDAEKLRDRLASTGEIKPDVFLCSPARRARETAEILAPVLSQPIVIDDDLEEWRSGDDYFSDEDFMKSWESLSDMQRPYYRWLEGHETMVEFSARVHQTLNRIIEANRDKTILIMSHGAYTQLSFAYFFGYSVAVPQHAVADIRKTSITHWHKRSNSNRWILERSNDYQHLT